MIRVCFSTLGCPDWTWQKILDCGPAAGFDGVEIRLLAGETDLLARPEFQPSELPQRRTDLANAGFEVAVLASSVRFDYPDAAERKQQLETGRAYLRLAAELGAPMVRVFGDVFPDEADEAARQTILDQVSDGLNQLGETAAELGRTVVIETHGDFAASAWMERLFQQVTSPAVGVLWDTHHPWRFYGEDPAETFARLQPYVRHTHWKDSVARPQQELKEDSRQAEEQARSLMSGHKPADYVLFGGGEFPAIDCMQLLQRAGYDGWYSLEWEKAWHPEIESPEVALPLFPAKIRQLARFAAALS